MSSSLNEDNILNDSNSTVLQPERSSNHVNSESFCCVKSKAEIFDERPRVSVLMEMTDRVGVLHDVLKWFWKDDINVSTIPDL
jgi:prephenate dehydratase